MGLDLRIPLGLMFLIIGTLLLGYGVLTLHSDMYARSMGRNVNVLWGGVMLLFGAGMYLLARRARSRLPLENVPVDNERVPGRVH